MTEKWHHIPLWRVVLALERKTLEWWNDPRSMATVLRSRCGHIYDWKRSPMGWLIRRRPTDELFQEAFRI
jgi:hypothetical protein